LLGQLLLISETSIQYFLLITGRQPALEPLLPPTQPSLLAPKPPPPILHAKEQPILIKQGSLDKSKGGKKDKVIVLVGYITFYASMMRISFQHSRFPPEAN
jgi:hypothetical protein